MFLEGMLMAATSINAEKCFIYIRDEYPAVLKILKNEIIKLENEKIIPLNYIDLEEVLEPIYVARKCMIEV